MSANGAIISRLRDEQETGERGMRQWSMFEIRGTTWYQIESGPKNTAPGPITTYITTDLQHALSQLQILSTHDVWAQMLVYSRLSGHKRAGYVLEPVQRIVRMSDGEYFVFLGSDLTLRDKCSSTENAPWLDRASEIYSRDE